MPLTRLRVESFGCVELVDIEPHAERSYVFGPNGAGKTSLLEAIHFLGRGRSFRTRNARRLIQWGQESFGIYGEARDAGGLKHRLGASLSRRGGGRRQLDGVEGAGISPLAEVLPVYVIDPGTHELIGGGPRARRQFLDWGVFHVEHSYLEAWRRFRRALSQRNAALKAGQPRKAVEPWSELLVGAGETIDAARRAYLEKIAPELERLGGQLLDAPIEARYQAGWALGSSLAEALDQSEERDRATGLTQVGPHRADLELRMGGRGVRETASRGQQKLIATALVLSQIEVGASSERPTLVVDDPAAELDSGRIGRILEAVFAAPAQVVLTGLAAEQLRPAPGYPVFHVEQGKVHPVV